MHLKVLAVMWEVLAESCLFDTQALYRYYDLSRVNPRFLPLEMDTMAGLMTSEK